MAGRNFACDGMGNITGNGPFDLCMEQLCVDNTMGDSIDVLVCKPGAANNVINVSLIGVDSLDFKVDSVVESCMTTLNITGAVEVTCNGGNTPPTVDSLPVTITSLADPMLQYLDCTTCLDPTFSYTGPKITNCDGDVFDYTVTVSETACAPAQSITKYVTVYPDIVGTLAKECVGDSLTFIFTPDPMCDGLIYEWCNSGGVVPFESDSILVVDPADGDTYTVKVYREETTPTCDTFTTSDIAFCCELDIACPNPDGGLFACISELPAADTNLITRIDSCFDLRFEVEEDTVGMGCVGDTQIVTRRYIVIDDDGYPMTTDERDTCIQTFRFVDSIAPMITCPVDITVDCIEDVPPANINSPTVSDNCTVNPVVTHIGDVSDGNTCPEIITRTISCNRYLRQYCRMYPADYCGR